ncbi:cyclic nucleotide-binding protein [Rippkaea orientalis PCC 8801]|uniref:Cyclic nucleotide-binding protein n=1 Tax=Rippkaea orientalis (strain PCC 8801 / RF-1) TaxID=41431 RepID=B7K6E5_RIPO1|nr:Crp/Fnr family transcriptional regulator [Rippkaea orientalis]ACK68198.1 cyclic nucleotide-binding protein [Rippkaea orientalis PCC 8801]
MAYYLTMSIENTLSINQLLGSLPPADYERIKSHVEDVTLDVGQILYPENEPIQEIYFPEQGLVTLISSVDGDSMMEIGLVGHEGVVGYPVFLGGQSSPHRAVVQIAGSAKKLPTQVIKEELQRGGEISRRLLAYTQALLTQVSQTAICNRHHNIDQRLARWLLSVQDCLNQDKFYLTHETISNMLGIRRAGVTVAAGFLQNSGLIRYRRGWITITNREGLKAASCECYGIVRQEYHRLLDFKDSTV